MFVYYTVKCDVGNHSLGRNATKSLGTLQCLESSHPMCNTERQILCVITCNMYVFTVSYLNLVRPKLELGSPLLKRYTEGLTNLHAKTGFCIATKSKNMQCMLYNYLIRCLN